MQSTSATRTLSSIATSSRCFSTSSAVLAGGKGPKKSTVRQAGKSKTSGYGSKGPKKSLNITGKSLKLTYSMAGPPTDLSSLSTYRNALETESIGRATRFSGDANEVFSSYGLPRGLQAEFSKGGGAATVVRQVTVDLTNTLESEAGSSSQDSRYMLAGDAGSGKSLLLVQAIAHAIAQDWVVIYAPQTHTWTDSSSPYAYNAKTQLFDQQALAAAVLQNILKANGTKLNSLKVDGQALPQFIREVARNETRTVRGLEQVVEAIAKQQERPVLFAADDVHTLFRDTAYRSPDFKAIEAYNLSMPRLFLDYLSGRKTLARGMTLSAYSHTTPSVALGTSFKYALELPSIEPITPYSKFEPIHLAHASSGFKMIEVPFGMSTREAAGMFDLWSKRKWVSSSNDEVFMHAYMAAAGNPKELSREWLNDRQPHHQFDPDAL